MEIDRAKTIIGFYENLNSEEKDFLFGLTMTKLVQKKIQPKKKIKRITWNKENTEELVSDLKNGLTIGMIANKFDANYGQIYMKFRRLKKEGLL